MPQTLGPALPAPDSADAHLPLFEIHDPTAQSVARVDFSPPVKAASAAVPEMCLTDEQQFHDSIDWFRGISDMAEQTLAGTGKTVFAPG